MNRLRIAPALCLLAAISTPLVAGVDPPEARPSARDADAAQSVPAYKTLYVAGSADAVGPQAVVRTAARTEDEWIAIGRDLRAKHPTFKAVVVHFYSDQAPALPKGYPDCADDQRRTFESWMLGFYNYQAKDFKWNSSGNPIERVQQSVIKPRARTLGGIDVTELSAPDLKATLAAPASTRIVQVCVVVPGLRQADLEKVAAAYEEQYQTPLLLRVEFFGAIPDWPDKPFATRGLLEHVARSYVRAATVDFSQKDQKVVPVEPEWRTPANHKPADSAQ